MAEDYEEQKMCSFLLAHPVDIWQTLTAAV